MRSRVFLLRPLASAAVLFLATLPMTAAETGTPTTTRAAGTAAVAAALARPDLAAYRGWIRYLACAADTAAARHGADSREAADARARLGDWVGRITADPGLLATLTGVQEWAYESPVDDSGQPFKLAIPTDYDPAHPAPLSVYLHGYSGNHLEHATGMASHPGGFEMSVLGRGRGGGYRALSEADVIQAIAYVQTHWAVDPDRIHLNGGSMGGGGTYRLGARFPHLWASGRPSCGFASHLPIGNLITFPVYATHSDDDWTVAVIQDRGPLARLRELGGQAILDETTGYGHEVWNYAEGNARGTAWEQFQVRPDSRHVRHIDYTALDGGAVRGWWAEVAEWGPAPKPARFILTAGEDNTLFAGLTNVARLRLRLAEAPFDRSQPLQVVVNGRLPITLPAPLPDTVVVALAARVASFECAPPPQPWRLHTPGGALLLYEGEPLLIIYGTRGTDAARRAMRAAAIAASKSPYPGWLDDSGEAGSDGVPHSQNLYGRLSTKADTEVTDADIARCHLVLIGTAAENTVVARLADRLPVRFAGGAITCDDGVAFPAGGRALGLVHYNPLAPGRLIFWVAADSPAAYAANSPIPALMGGDDGSRTATVCGADLLVMDTAAPTLVAARSFDSRWHWTPGRKDSPLLPARIRTHRDYAAMVGAAILRAVDADFAIVRGYGPLDSPAVTPGVTRAADVEPLFYWVPMETAEMSGAEIMDFVRKVTTAGDPPLTVCQAPHLRTGAIRPDHRYRIAIPYDAIGRFTAIGEMAPGHSRHPDLTVGDAVERYLESD